MAVTFLNKTFAQMSPDEFHAKCLKEGYVHIHLNGLNLPSDALIVSMKKLHAIDARANPEGEYNANKPLFRYTAFKNTGSTGERGNNNTGGTGGRGNNNNNNKTGATVICRGGGVLKYCAWGDVLKEGKTPVRLCVYCRWCPRVQPVSEDGGKPKNFSLQFNTICDLYVKFPEDDTCNTGVRHVQSRTGSTSNNNTGSLNTTNRSNNSTGHLSASDMKELQRLAGLRSII